MKDEEQTTPRNYHSCRDTVGLVLRAGALND